MKTIYKNINGVLTEILTWGEPFRKSVENVIVCVTGNPGVPHFYIDFAKNVYNSLQMPVCIIGHAGHVNVPIGFQRFSKSSNDQDFYDLKTQLNHKLDFLQNHLCSSAKIHFIGHSIGAWMIVELLEKNDYLMEKVSSVNLLFPTLQRMAESSNGKFFNNVVRRLQTIILFILRLVYVLPEFLFTFLINLYLKFRCLPLEYSSSILKVINPLVMRNVIFLASDEMDTVNSLNSNGIAKIKHITNVIYGKDDGWAPIEYMEELKKFEPCLKMNLVPIEHAFVLKSSECVAEMVADFIRFKSN